MKSDLVERLLKRADIRRQIKTRKSAQEGKPDRIADLLEEAAEAIALFDVDRSVYDRWLDKTKRDTVCHCALSCIGACQASV